MANKALFASHVKSAPVPKARPANTVNEAGGRAYKLDSKLALALYAATGCLNGTYYTNAQDQLKKTIELAGDVDTNFLAHLAVYTRVHGFMKDMPALLTTMLADRDSRLFRQVFPLVIDNGRMLRTFVQMVRSGAVSSHRSITGVKRKMIFEWLERADSNTLINSMVGNDPSLADIISLAHPKPKDREQGALFGYITGTPEVYTSKDESIRNKRQWHYDSLPQAIKDYELFKRGETTAIPHVPFLMLAGLETTSRATWKEIARRSSWTQLRMNLNTFERHGCFNDPALVNELALRLRNPELIARSKVFPYQLLSAFLFANDTVPAALRESISAAMEIAIENVPEIKGGVAVCPDVSGSMGGAISGQRGGGTSKMTYQHISALTAAAFIRRSKGSVVVPFEDKVVNVTLDSRSRVLENAAILSRIGGGGTRCGAALEKLNRDGAQQKLVVFVSDNMSWVDMYRGRLFGQPKVETEMMKEWNRYKARVKDAKLVCLDVSPATTSQAYDRKDILNVGGFSDTVFQVIDVFAREGLDAGNWVRIIEGISLDGKAQYTKDTHISEETAD